MNFIVVQQCIWLHVCWHR